MADSAEFLVSLKDEVSGPADEMLSSITGLSGGLTGLLGAALGAVAGLGALVVAGAGLALEMSDARAKLDATMNALAGSTQAGQATIAMIDQLGASTGLTRDELSSMAEKLMAVGIQGDALKAQLTALASIKALTGDAGVTAYESALAKLNEGLPVTAKQLLALQEAGIPVDAIAKQLGYDSLPALQKALKSGKVSAQQFKDAMTNAVTASGAQALEVQANSLANQWARFKESIGHLFEGVDAGPFLAGLKSVLHLFDADTASGKAMKAAITATFNAIFSLAAKVFPYIKKAIELVIIAALKIYIAFKPVIAAFKQLVSDGGPSIDFLKFFKLELGGFVAMGQRVANSIMFVIKAIVFLQNTFQHAKDAAKEMIQGLVDGISNGAGAVWDAIKAMATGAMDTLKKTLGISSPSKVFAGFGKHVGAGFAQGITGASVQVEHSAGKMSAAAIGGATKAAAPKAHNDNGKGGGKVIHVTFATGAIQVSGAGQSAQEISEHTMALALERVALTQGLGRT